MPRGINLASRHFFKTGQRATRHPDVGGVGASRVRRSGKPKRGTFMHTVHAILDVQLGLEPFYRFNYVPNLDDTPGGESRQGGQEVVLGKNALDVSVHMV